MIGFNYPQSFIARVAGRLRRRAIKTTDRRVRLMNEILTCIKLIKVSECSEVAGKIALLFSSRSPIPPSPSPPPQMYAWEVPFSKHIGEIRKEEKGILRTAAYIQSTLASLVPVAPVVAGAMAFSLTTSTGHDLTAADAFTTLTLFNLMRFSLSAVPRAVRVCLL